VYPDACGNCGGVANSTDAIYVIASGPDTFGFEELYIFRGPGSNLQFFYDVNGPLAFSSNISYMQPFRGEVIFVATTPQNKREILIVDTEVLAFGSSFHSGLRKIYNNVGGEVFDPEWLQVAGRNRDKLLFVGDSVLHGREVFLLSSSSTVTPFPMAFSLLLDTRPGTATADPKELKTVLKPSANNSDSDYLSFVFSGNYPFVGREPYIMSAPGVATLMADLEPGIGSSNPRDFSHASGVVVFSATTTASGDELFGGSAASLLAYNVRDIMAGPTSSSPSSFVAVDAKTPTAPPFFFFTAAWPAYGVEALYTSGKRPTILNGLPVFDATLLSDFYPGPTSGNPGPIQFLGTKRFLIATTNQYGVDHRTLFIQTSTEIGSTYTYPNCTILPVQCQEGQFSPSLFNTNNTIAVPTLNNTNTRVAKCVYNRVCYDTNVTAIVNQIGFSVVARLFSLPYRFESIEEFVIIPHVGVFIAGTTAPYGLEMWFINPGTTSFVVLEYTPGVVGFDSVKSPVGYRNSVYFFAKTTGNTLYSFFVATPTGVQLVTPSIVSTVRQAMFATITPGPDDCGVCGGGNRNKNNCGICFQPDSLCPRDCFGVIGGGAVRDLCGTCRSSPSHPDFNSACKDCAGVPNGRSVIDRCGNCNIPDSPCFNQGCLSCDGMVTGGKELDMCNVCGGNNSTCVDCNGVFHPDLAIWPPVYANNHSFPYFVNFTRSCQTVVNVVTRQECSTFTYPYVDEQIRCTTIGELTPPATLILYGCLFSNGTFLPNARPRIPSGCTDVPVLINNNGTISALTRTDVVCEPYPVFQCRNINMTRPDALTVSPGPFAVKDPCGVCGGSGSSCIGCDGVSGSGAIIDGCQRCVRVDSPLYNTSCRDCKGVIDGNAFIDACGVCNFFGSPFANFSCIGCDGKVASGKVIDECYVCDGDGTSCYDCTGTKYGINIVDVCGNCKNYTDSTFDKGCDDCLGVPAGPAVIDFCGVCNGFNASCFDCFDVYQGNATRDVCGVCRYANDTLRDVGCDDCLGIAGGQAVVDICNVCNGFNASCTDCAGVFLGNATRDICGVCNGQNETCVDCFGVFNGTAAKDACHVCRMPGDPLKNTTCLGNVLFYCLSCMCVFCMCKRKKK
jgi:hypothetical protein